MSCDNFNEIYKEQLMEELEDLKIAIKDAVKIKEYTLDTGQGSQKVTRQSLQDLYDRRNQIMQELQTICDSANGSNTYVVS